MQGGRPAYLGDQGYKAIACVDRLKTSACSDHRPVRRAWIAERR